MKLLIDAQLPRRIAYRFREAGYDCLYTLDLPEQNLTSDESLLNIAERDDRIIVTKDADFVSSFMLYRQPNKLLLISTGNITNTELEQVLLANLHKIAEEFTSNSFNEITRSSLIVHF